MFVSPPPTSSRGWKFKNLDHKSTGSFIAGDIDIGFRQLKVARSVAGHQTRSNREQVRGEVVCLERLLKLTVFGSGTMVVRLITLLFCAHISCAGVGFAACWLPACQKKEMGKSSVPS